MTAPLSILSTKTLDEGAHTFARQHDWVVQEASFISIRPLPLHTDTLPVIDADTIVVFTSENAVLHFPVQHYREYSNWHIACLAGKTVQQALTLFAPAQVVATAQHSAAIATAITGLRRFKQAVFFCAKDHRPELPQALHAAQLPVTIVPVYETIATGTGVPGNFDAVLFFSPSGVQSFFSRQALPAGAICFAIGPTTAESLRPHTNAVITSPDTTQLALLGCVLQYFDNKL